MDKNSLGTETTIPGGIAQQSAKPEVQMAKPQSHQQPIPQYPPQQPPSRKGRRSADPKEESAAPKAEEPKKRNVESHLSGTIVVQNQDVNEYNRRESY